MPAPKTAQKSALTIAVLIAIAVLKYCNGGAKQPASPTPPVASAPHAEKSAPKPVAKPPAKVPSTSKSNASVVQKNGWTVYQNCQISSHHNNDGDSFRVKLPDASVEEFRLYFVDTPESTFKRYRDGNTNAERIAQQARYFGGITPEATTAAGTTAKKFTLALLTATPFTLYTQHEDVYESGRFYAHVSVVYEGKTRWLDEILVSKGYVRIITQPADLPDGTKAETHRTLLRKMEAEAKRNHVGAWK